MIDKFTSPEFDELPFEGKRIGRGFASFKEYINLKGRPKAGAPKVSISIRIPYEEKYWTNHDKYSNI